MVYYLAYGSNLNKKQMACRCPDAQPVMAGTLHGYQLEFRGAIDSSFATITRNNESTVEVGIWCVSDDDVINLDQYEGVPNHYKKETLLLEVDGQESEVLVYIMTQGRRVGLPNLTYLEFIEQGYEDFNLDKDSLQKALERTATEVDKYCDFFNHPSCFKMK